MGATPEPAGEREICASDMRRFSPQLVTVARQRFEVELADCYGPGPSIARRVAEISAMYTSVGSTDEYALRIQPISVESAERRVRIQAKWLSEVGLTSKPVVWPLSFCAEVSLFICRLSEPRFAGGHLTSRRYAASISEQNGLQVHE
jgi:hypothetical protein